MSRSKARTQFFIIERNRFTNIIDLLLWDVVQKVQNLLKMLYTQLNVKENTRYLIQITCRAIAIYRYNKSKNERNWTRLLKSVEFLLYILELSFDAYIVHDFKHSEQILLMQFMILSILSSTAYDVHVFKHFEHD